MTMTSESGAKDMVRNTPTVVVPTYRWAVTLARRQGRALRRVTHNGGSGLA
jgi:hypothetical protein